jgi:DNA invertase Pin-like site-specific DNA recombinase
MRACAYIRVSTELQGEDGYSLDHQDQLVRKTIQDRDWTLTTIFEEVASTAKPLAKRRQLKRCLNELDQHEHDVLVITRLDRLCRSSLDFADTLARADQHGWQLLCLDPAVDLTSPYGRALAGVAAVFAQLERELISQRTKEAMQTLKARGKPLGAPPYADRQVIRTIVRLKDAGYSDRQVADTLNLERVPAHRGGPWYQSTINRTYQRALEAKKQREQKRATRT